ncbi:hypothetical protein [Halomonas elongata]|uniref:hypothetical protein n=1 Tax=Halomonas elongata TaxID=2746 RepID=UPI00186B5FEC|nr:hypothetical protein [Halomonas elongata]MBW5800091.1 hypothetical protein [Halomonas elongata]
MYFEEARRVVRALRKPEQWSAHCHYLTHKPTGWSLWIANGPFFIRPYFPVSKAPDHPEWAHSEPARYGVLEKLIIWYGGARRWHRWIKRESIRRARFKGDA